MSCSVLDLSFRMWSVVLFSLLLVVNLKKIIIINRAVYIDRLFAIERMSSLSCLDELNCYYFEFGGRDAKTTKEKRPRP